MLSLTKLEILLSTALLCALIALVYFAFLLPEGCPSRLQTTIKTCNEIIAATQANCQQYIPKSWNISSMEGVWAAPLAS